MRIHSEAGVTKFLMRMLFLGARVLFLAAAFDVLLEMCIHATETVMLYTVFDMYGQLETHRSGQVFSHGLSELLMSLGPFAFLPSRLLAGLVWAVLVEAAYAIADPRRECLSAVLFCVASTVLMYCGISSFAAWNIGDFVHQGKLIDESLPFRVLLTPILKGLTRGIGPSFVFGYAAMWGIPLGSAAWVTWRFVITRKLTRHREAREAEELCSGTK